MGSQHPPPPRHPARIAAAALGFTLALLAWSAYKPHDRMTWVLEVSPAVAAMVLLGATYRRFPLSPLSYVLIALHAAILIVGGHYTYALVPPGRWVQEWLDLSRNHYDRLGHLAQGFVPAIVAREVLQRCTPLKPGGWLYYLTVSVCVAISGVYELVEWAVAEVDAGGSQAFLGTQGDVWDTQKDIALCLVGAMTSPLLLGWLHQRQLVGRGLLRWAGRLPSGQ
ncbi:MAG: DUF2238 domain-containing protein [Phycisphaerales bacterium]|nr:DUF2238 domain-containing protein [Phycisphaerales bacterium]